MSTPQHIGVIGEGKMGTNLFRYLSGFDLRLTWLCSRDADAEALERSFRKKLDRQNEAGIITGEHFAFRSGNTRVTKDPSDLFPCDLIIESVTEDAAIKQKLFREIDALTGESCIFASNSSSIDPSLLVPSERRAGNFLGFHFFYPVQVKNIAEVILTDKTSPATRETAKTFAEKIGRRILLLNEKNGFILNRIFLDVQNEAFLMTGEGKVDFRMLDAVVMPELFPSGIFLFFDSVGIDTMLASVRNYIRDYPHRDYYRALVKCLEGMVAEGRLGQKSGDGFYRQGEDPAGTLLPDPGIVRQITERLKLAYVSSAKRFALQSRLPLSEVNDAMTEYLGTGVNLLH